MYFTFASRSARIALCALALSALIGCKGTSTTPSTSASATPGPNATSTTITVESGPNAPIEHVQVVLSSALNGSEPTGTIYGNSTTPPNGEVSFSHLPSYGQICITATERFYSTYNACPKPLAATVTVTMSP